MPRFIHDTNVSFTNNTAEQQIWMAKVKQKISRCFRTPEFAQAYCRISRYWRSMGALGDNPIVAIAIALKRNAADRVNENRNEPDSTN